MAPLSKDLCGVILPYDVFGTHLNKSGKKVDVELEKNFRKAGELLADLWSEHVIDGHPVVAEFVHPDENIKSNLRMDNKEELDSTGKSLTCFCFHCSVKNSNDSSSTRVPINDTA